MVLVGHSRGGEGVDKASLQIPLGAPYTIAGQVLLAPTNFATQTAAYVPTVTVLPYCDGDVIDLQGQKFTDSARDLAADDTSLKSSVLVMGANHNFFNTEWTPGIAVAPAFDDWFGDELAACGTATPTRLTPEKQRAVGLAYVAGAVDLFARGDQRFLPMYDGSQVQVASTGDAQVLSHAIGGGRVLRRPDRAGGLALAQGASTHFCEGAVQQQGLWSFCGRGNETTIQTPHWPDSGELVPTRREFEMSWTAAGQSGGMVFDRPMDLTGRRLEMRTIVDPDRGDVQLSVRLTDADGASAVVTPEGGGILPALPLGDELSKRWAQALLVDPTLAAGVDLSRVTGVELVAVSTAGRVWVLDVASAPDALTPVPERRLALVDVGALRTQEGDGPGTQVAQVPITITGTLPARASITVAVVSYAPRVRPHRMTVDLAAGQTSAMIDLTYSADTVDDYPRLITSLMAWANNGVMVDQAFGRLVVLDDDPTPKLRLVPDQRRVSEGQPARWTIRLSRRVDYDLYPRVFVIADGKARRLSVADVPRQWLLQTIGRAGPPGRPLDAIPFQSYARIRAGWTSGEFTIPTVRDGTRERREAVTLSVRAKGQRVDSTVWVTG